MKALISPLEPRYTGYRIASVNENEFEVASPLFWIDCEESVKPDFFWYDPVDKTIKANPPDITEG